MSTTAIALAAAAALAGPPGLLVSPADLAARLANPALVVIHIEDRGNDFANGHVPGARLVRYDQIAVDGPDQLGSELPAVDALRDVFHAVGVGAGSQVVVYGSAIAATRAFFTLDYLGHPNVRVLNGGLGGWRVAGQKVELGPPAAARRDAGMGGMHPAGHLAGARQLVWTDLVSRSSQFLPEAELRAKLDAAGAKPGVPVVSYCMVGMRASVIYFVARHLGYDAKMYDGSILDWGHRKLPVRSGRP